MRPGGFHPRGGARFLAGFYPDRPRFTRSASSSTIPGARRASLRASSSAARVRTVCQSAAALARSRAVARAASTGSEAIAQSITGPETEDLRGSDVPSDFRSDSSVSRGFSASVGLEPCSNPFGTPGKQVLVDAYSCAAV
jgi:hypothetical protein